ncbi:MAG: hypothetical protein HY672_02045 [Chloroflexi bacterium]|nr:hypothetical protein [Chloroflexota bacterium]
MPLETAKEGAGAKMFVSEPAKVEWFGSTFGVYPRGIHGYEWVLVNSDVAVAMARKAQGGTVFPEVYITYRSEFLWRVGYVAAAKEFGSWLATWAEVVGVRVSRMDVCVDLAMPMPKLDVAVEVVSRARKKASHFQMKSAGEYITGGHVTGHEFGSNHLVGRIYDKTLEIKVSHKGWFRDVWESHGWDGKGTVVRVELQLRRQVLKEFGVNTLEELRERMGDLWRYCTQDWLTVCVPGADSNHARWGIRDYWTVVQDVGKDLGEMYGVLRLRQKRVQYDALGAQAKGVLATMVATMATEVG